MRALRDRTLNRVPARHHGPHARSWRSSRGDRREAPRFFRSWLGEALSSSSPRQQPDGPPDHRAWPFSPFGGYPWGGKPLFSMIGPVGSGIIGRLFWLALVNRASN